MVCCFLRIIKIVSIIILTPTNYAVSSSDVWLRLIICSSADQTDQTGSMPSFSFFTPWCSCGKPMALECSDDPSDFFSDLSFEAAKEAHWMYLKSEKQFAIPSVVAKVDDVVTISVSGMPDTLVLNTSLDVKVNATFTDTPEFPDVLSAEQITMLEERKWDNFMGTIDSSSQCVDIKIYEADNVMLCRAMITSMIVPKSCCVEHDRVVSLTYNIISCQINAWGKVFMEGELMSHKCTWTSAEAQVERIAFQTIEIEKPSLI